MEDGGSAVPVWHKSSTKVQILTRTSTNTDAIEEGGSAVLSVDFSGGCNGAGAGAGAGAGGVADCGGWDHVWLDAVIGIVAGHDAKVSAYLRH